MSGLKKTKPDLFKIVMCAAALCVVMIILLDVYAYRLEAILAKIREKGMPNMEWVVEHLGLFLPVAVLVGVLAILYCRKDRYIPVISQREQFYISLITMAFTYLCMLPYAVISSKNGVEPDPELTEEVKTLWELSATWFFFQFIPLVIMVSYHAIRAGSEEKELAAESEVKKG